MVPMFWRYGLHTFTMRSNVSGRARAKGELRESVRPIFAEHNKEIFVSSLVALGTQPRGRPT